MGTLVYVEWEEKTVSNEPGKKVVHYFLKRRDGNPPDLAVVGKERTIRHMSYKFVLRCPPSSLPPLPLGGKLKSRREVRDWLSLVVADSSSHEPSQYVGRFPVSNGGFGADIQSLKDAHARSLEPHSKEFSWLGSASTCRKRRKHYRSFCRNGITISVNDFVYVLAEENKRLVAYLEDLYEDSRENRTVVVRWFHKIDEVGIVLPPNFNDREIFFSLCLQDLSVECIDGLATVLSPQHFEKYQNEAAHTLWQPFMCHRQFDNDNITEFDITQVQGYWKQEILRFMYTTPAPKELDPKPLEDNLEMQDGDSNDDDTKTRPKKKRRRSKSKEIDDQLNDSPVEAGHMNVPKLSNGLTRAAGADVHAFKEPKSSPSLSMKVKPQNTPQKHLAVGCHIEVLSQDSGIRGCWFRAVVIKKSREKVKVRYEDLKDAEDETKPVEEWVFASRFAATDELGIRLCGRNTIRPPPSSNKDDVSLGFVDIGTPVDAWWHDGWWEGIVVRKEPDDKSHVYFPGEKKLEIFDCNNMRHSQDWLCNKWNFIESKPELVSSILSSLDTKQGSKSCDGTSDLIQPDLVDSVSPKEPKTSVSPKETKSTINLANDNFLAQLRWNSTTKRRRCRDRSRRNSGKQNSEGSSSSSREYTQPSPDCLYLTPNSLKFDHESCKYQGDSLLNVSIPSLTGLVLSR